MNFRLHRGALLLAAMASLLRADYTSAPLDQATVQQLPYELVGIVVDVTGSVRGSGAVVGDPRIVLSCAHLPFDSGRLTWGSDNYWVRAWYDLNGNNPGRSDGQVLRGYWKFASYADMVSKNGSDSEDTFAVDFVAYYSYEALGPASAGFWYDGQSALVNPAAKCIVGYPVGLYSSSSTQRNLMHEAGPFNLAFTQMRNAYNQIETVATGPGNSGGPVFVTNEAALGDSDHGLRFAAVLVSGSEKSLHSAINSAGVVAVTAPEWDLVNGALNATGEPPINDAWAAALALSGATATSAANNTLATKETGEPKHAGNAGGHSLWWSWTAPGDGTVSVNTVGSDFDTVLAVYTGTGVSALNPVAADDQGGGNGTSALTFDAAAGTPYWIAVDGKDGATGNITLSLTFSPPAPANDAFANASVIIGLSAQVIGHNLNATKEPGEPSHAGDAGGRSVWWKWTAPGSGQVFLTTAGSKFDTLLAVYTGTAVNALSVVASNDDPAGTDNDSSTLSFLANGGTTYMIAVDGWSSASGVINLTLDFTPTLPMIATQPAGQAVAAGSPVMFSVVARGAVPLSYQWKKDGVNLAGATAQTCVLASVQASDVGSYSVVVSNNAGNVTSSAAVLALTGPPAVATQPADATVAAGQSAAFTVAAVGAPAPTYQWQRLPAGSTTWLPLTEGGSYSGTTTSTLTVTFPTVAMSGDQFRCVLTNSLGSVTTNVATVTVNTGLATTFLFYPAGVALDGAGSVYVADSSANTIMKITSAGAVSTLAGTAGIAGAQDGTGTNGRFNQPVGVAVDGAGNVYVADAGNATIRKITPAGAVTTLAGSAANRGSLDGTGTAALFSSPAGIAVDGAGNLYVADSVNATIRKITTGGTVTSLAGSPTNRGDADGTGTSARFNYPNGLAVDSSGNLYVADTYNDTIRKVTPGGVVTTLAGSAGISGSNDGTGVYALFGQPYGIAVDSNGNARVADTGNGTIRKVTASGVVTTSAGIAGIAGLRDGASPNALFNQPRGLAVDGAGNVFVVDSGNATIRKVAVDGTVTTLAMSAAASGNSSTTTGSTGTTSGGGGGGGGGGAMEGWIVAGLVLLGAARWATRKSRMGRAGAEL